MYYEYNELPTSYFIYDAVADNYITQYAKKTAIDIIDEVLKLAGSTKIAPAKRQLVTEYLKEPQPHLKYLVNTQP